MTEVYNETAESAAVDYRELWGVSVTKPIQAAKDAVPTIDLADRLCGPGQMRRVGDRWVARCPLPDHEDKSPSFVVYPGDGGWWCFGCGRGGDVVNLAQFAWDIERPGVAAAEVLMEFGHEVPQRPPAWFRKQERQRCAREAVDEVRKNVFCRRLFKYSILPLIDAIEDADERDRELERAWREFRGLLP